MSNQINSNGDFNAELIAGYVIGDLTSEELREFDVAKADSRLLHEVEVAAAAVQLMFAGDPDEETTLPTNLRDSIRDGAANYVGTAAATKELDRPKSNPIGRRELLAWASMAAALCVAVGLWATRNQQPGTQNISVADARAELVGSASDLIQADWGPGKTPFETPVSGDVVWSGEQQKGFMRFPVGLPVNDRSVSQYQLWIIDPQRDDEPVDGGVFDATDDGEVIVPIDAKLQVVSPAAFAITIEQPGGVVVSTQERLPLLASVN